MICTAIAYRPSITLSSEILTISGKLHTPSLAVATYWKNEMPKKLQITLDEEATKKYLDWASGITTAHLEADCEPCGVSITIEIGNAMFGSTAYANVGGGLEELGDADVDFA